MSHHSMTALRFLFTHNDCESNNEHPNDNIHIGMLDEVLIAIGLNASMYYGSKGRQINIGWDGFYKHTKIIGQTGFHMLHNKYTFYY